MQLLYYNGCENKVINYCDAFSYYSDGGEAGRHVSTHKQECSVMNELDLST